MGIRQNRTGRARLLGSGVLSALDLSLSLSLFLSRNVGADPFPGGGSRGRKAWAGNLEVGPRLWVCALCSTGRYDRWDDDNIGCGNEGELSPTYGGE